MASKKPAAERFAKAKRDVAQFGREQSELDMQWLECLLNDDELGAERCEHQIDVVARKLKRARALVERLPLQVQRDQSEADNPSTAAACEEKLFRDENRRLQLLAMKRQGPVSAGHDAELDRLTVRCGAMRARRDYLRKLEANSRGEAA